MRGLPTYRPLYKYEEQMVERMVQFDLKYPHHLPWEKLVHNARGQIVDEPPAHLPPREPGAYMPNYPCKWCGSSDDCYPECPGAYMPADDPTKLTTEQRAEMGCCEGC